MPARLNVAKTPSPSYFRHEILTNTPVELQQ